MNVSEAILSRASKRAFTAEPVSDETIRSILDVARRAPSGGNLQPWHVYVVNGEVRDRFVELIERRLIESPAGEEPEYHVYPPDLIEPYKARRSRVGAMMFELLGVAREDRAGKLRQFARNYRFFDAPAGLFFSIDRSMQEGQWADLGMFIQNVMLLAREHGLDTCPQESWAIWHSTICEFCGIPDNEMLFCGMALGHADAGAPVNRLVAERAEVDEFTRFVR